MTKETVLGKNDVELITRVTNKVIEQVDRGGGSISLAGRILTDDWVARAMTICLSPNSPDPKRDEEVVKAIGRRLQRTHGR